MALSRARLRRYGRWWRHNGVEPWRQLRRGTLRRYLADRYILRFKIRPVKRIEGWLTPAEAAALYRLATTLPAEATVVEIGSWKGKSTYCLARGLSPASRLIAIDPFDAAGERGSDVVYTRRQGDRPVYEQFQTTMERLAVADRVEAWRGYSRDFVDGIPAMHMLFIDGDHSRAGCAYDFEHYGPRLRPGGYLGFHDYHPERGDAWGPNWVIERLVLAGGDYRFVGRFDSLWLARKM